MCRKRVCNRLKRRGSGSGWVGHIDCECPDFGMARQVFDCSCIHKDKLEGAAKHAKIEEAEEGCAVELSVPRWKSEQRQAYKPRTTSQ